MRRFLLLLALAFVPLVGFCDAGAPPPVSFDFAGVSLVTFGQATFKNLLDRDFVMSPEVVAMDRKISMHVKSLPVAEVPAFVESILAGQGIVSTLRDGVYYLTVKSATPVAAMLPVVDTTVAAAAPHAGVHIAPVDLGAGQARDGAAASVRRIDDVSDFYPLRNRSAEFVAAVIGAAFGRQAVAIAGSDLVLTAPKALLVKIKKLIAALDVAPRTIEVSASFVEVARSSSSSRGVSLVASVLGGKLSGSVGQVGASGVLSLGAANFQVVLDALESDGRFRQVSSGRVVGDEQEKMTLSVGDETPTISSTSKDNQGNPIQSVLYRPSGVILDVTSRVAGSGVLTLAVDGQISSFQSTVTGVSGSPTLIKRQVKTRVSVADGEVLVIGGLDDTKTVGAHSGLSFLPRSWGAGSSSDTHTDLVLILSARVLKRDAPAELPDAPAGS